MFQKCKSTTSSNGRLLPNKTDFHHQSISQLEEFSCVEEFVFSLQALSQNCCLLHPLDWTFGRQKHLVNLVNFEQKSTSTST